MNITFLIGNGFDIKLGLKTRYTDFYPVYIASNKDKDINDSTKRFADLIDSNYDTWADFEMAFAKNAFGTKNDVCDILYDFTSEFVDYLKEQEELCDYSDESNIYNEFRNFIMNGHQKLERRDRQTMEKIYDSSDDYKNIVLFVNFNYTHILSNIIDICKKVLGPYIGHRINNGIRCETTLGRVLHIHGHIDDSVLIGIDSREQLKNENLKNDDSIDKYCVKSSMNIDIGNSQIEKDFIDIINKSNIIYAYGLSFGESDKSRWDVVAQWLKSNQQHKLIIYKYKTGFQEYNGGYKRKLLDVIEKEKDYYLGLLGFDKSDYSAYYEQIFIIDSDDVLDIKLIHDAKNEILNNNMA